MCVLRDKPTYTATVSPIETLAKTQEHSSHSRHLLISNVVMFPAAPCEIKIWIPEALIGQAPCDLKELIVPY